jgi:hypothetical protein
VLGEAETDVEDDGDSANVKVPVSFAGYGPRAPPAEPSCADLSQIVTTLLMISTCTIVL